MESSRVWTRAKSQDRFANPVTPFGFSYLVEAHRSNLHALARELGQRPVEPESAVRLIDSRVFVDDDLFADIRALRPRPAWVARVALSSLAAWIQSSVRCVLDSRLKWSERVPLVGPAIGTIQWVRAFLRGDSRGVGNGRRDAASHFLMAFCEWMVVPRTKTIVSEWNAELPRHLRSMRASSARALQVASGKESSRAVLERYESALNELIKNEQNYNAIELSVHAYKSFLFDMLNAWAKTMAPETGLDAGRLAEGWCGSVHAKLLTALHDARSLPNGMGLAYLRDRIGHLSEEADPIAAVFADRPGALEALFATAPGRDLGRRMPHGKKAWVEAARTVGDEAFVTEAIECLETLVVCGEEIRFFASTQSAAVRRLALAVGAELARLGDLSSPEDVFFFSLPELREFIQGSRLKGPHGEWKAMISGRKLAYQKAAWTPAPVELPDAAVSSTLEGGWTFSETYLHPAIEGFGSSPRALTGIGVSRGHIRGRAKLIRRMKDLDSITRGDILVLAMPSAMFTTSFTRAAGLVCDVGHALSAAAVTARELKLPAVFGVSRGLGEIRDGDFLEVDAEAGLVRHWAEGAEKSPQVWAQTSAAAELTL